MATKADRMTPDEIKEHWDYIQRGAGEYETWPEWMKNAFSVNYRAESASKQTQATDGCYTESKRNHIPPLSFGTFFGEYLFHFC